MYPEELVAPMRADLTDFGFDELKTEEAVSEHFTDHKGTSLIVINSVCGCAAGAARPGVKYGLSLTEKKPDYVGTVFAGVDMEATAKIRELHAPYPPSSPSIALFKDGELIHFVERHHIEGRNAEMIGQHIAAVVDEYC